MRKDLQEAVAGEVEEEEEEVAEVVVEVVSHLGERFQAQLIHIVQFDFVCRQTSLIFISFNKAVFRYW